MKFKWKLVLTAWELFLLSCMVIRGKTKKKYRQGASSYTQLINLFDVLKKWSTFRKCSNVFNGLWHMDLSTMCALTVLVSMLCSWKAAPDFTSTSRKKMWRLWLWCHAIVTEFLLWRLKLSDLAVPMLVFWNKTWKASDGLTVKVVVVHCTLIGW